MLKKSGSTFYCFSPFIMALTFAAEVLLFMYVLVTRGWRSLELRLILAVLFFLAMFQLAEYGVCESLVFDAQTWGKIGFVSITMLPPLGVHLVQAIRKDTSHSFTLMSYALGVLFSVAFVFFNTFDKIACLGNYAIFEFGNDLGIAFAIYYYALLLLGAGLAFNGWRSIRRKKDKKALMAVVFGYATFVLPASFIHFVLESEGNGLPSIMCGFAVIFAFILALYIAPLVRDK